MEACFTWLRKINRLKNEINILTPAEPWEAFANHYLTVRKMEGRVLSDEELRLLPDNGFKGQLAIEWKQRKQNLKKLISVLHDQLDSGAHILDLGCGNGWMTNKLAEAGFQAFGVDVNLPELEQANRVFSNEALQFAFADVFTWNPKQQFDAAIISSVLQYFSSPQKLLQTLFERNPKLKCVFISDTKFYAIEHVEDAAERTRAYYGQQGVPEMAAHYHHHTLASLGHPYVTLQKERHPIMRKLIGGSLFPIIKVNRTL